MGIEPTWSAWKAETLPLSYTRACLSRIPYYTAFVNDFFIFLIKQRFYFCCPSARFAIIQNAIIFDLSGFLCENGARYLITNANVCERLRNDGKTRLAKNNSVWRTRVWASGKFKRFVQIAFIQLTRVEIYGKLNNVRDGSAIVANANRTICYGRVPEWPKGTDCKSVSIAFGGSNPPPSTNVVKD